MTTLSVAVSSNSDNGYYRSAGFTGIDNTSGLLLTDLDYSVFCMFRGITIPKDSTISSALWLMTNATGKEHGATVRTAMEDTATPTPYAGNSKPLWPRTPESPDITFTTINEAVTSLDITTALQAVVNRTDWVSGGAVSAVVRYVAPHPTVTVDPDWYSYDESVQALHPETIPKLTVEYLLAGEEPPTPPDPVYNPKPSDFLRFF